MLHYRHNRNKTLSQRPHFTCQIPRKIYSKHAVLYFGPGFIVVIIISNLYMVFHWLFMHVQYLLCCVDGVYFNR